jgi:hypothetical protein
MEFLYYNYLVFFLLTIDDAKGDGLYHINPLLVQCTLFKQSLDNANQEIVAEMKKMYQVLKQIAQQRVYVTESREKTKINTELQISSKEIEIQKLVDQLHPVVRHLSSLQ